MEAPEYLICLNCETPCYVFEWRDGEVLEAFCETCAEEDTDGFMTEEEYEGMLSADDR